MRKKDCGPFRKSDLLTSNNRECFISSDFICFVARSQQKADISSSVPNAHELRISDFRLAQTRHGVSNIELSRTSFGEKIPTPRAI